MEENIYLKIILKYVATICLIITICTKSADAKGRARLSYNVAQGVCKSTAAFLISSQIESPIKTSIVNDETCKTLTWSSCAIIATCQKFKLKDCQAQSHSKPHGNKERKTPRIINGTDAKPHEFPHLVRITRNDGPHCDGTIVNENYIVTAAHCVFNLWGEGTNNTFKVIAGDHNTKVVEDTEQIRTVANAIYHENYDPANKHGDDIAVLLLDQPLEISESVLPPEMPQLDYDALGELVTVAGWGLLTPTGGVLDLPDILQKVDLTVGLCGSAYPVNETIFICANSDGGGQTPCKGDSGGPLTKKLDNGCHLFLGVVSFGYQCRDIYPSVYTKVSSYIDWINSNTEDC